MNIVLALHSDTITDDPMTLPVQKGGYGKYSTKRYLVLSIGNEMPILLTKHQNQKLQRHHLTT
jgi:hypothetical protein